jgi:L-ribulose-5-phosphate 4-epimerase
MSNYEDIKEECYEANLLLPEYKLIDVTFGNVSVAEPARGVFAIKPSGVDYATMRVEDLVVVDFEGKIVEGPLRPSSDTPTHCRLLQAFKGIRTPITSMVRCR